MMPPASRLFRLLLLLMTATLHAQTETERGILLTGRNGVEVATFHKSIQGRPVLIPVLTPSGKSVTRNWPVLQARPGEQKDHPHHKSLWFAHGDVNGHDFWTEGKGMGRILSLSEPTSAKSPTNEVISLNKWVSAEGEIICTDERRIKVESEGPTNIIDYTVTLRASHGALQLGDTKEGTMAIRLHPALRVKGDVATGRAVNSAGDKGGELWGRRSRWVHYFGKIADATVGVAILDHPNNLRHPTHWQARTYGLVAANPFGVHYFEKQPRRTGDVHIKAGDSRVFRYRFLISDIHLTEQRIEDHWKVLAALPSPRPPSLHDESLAALEAWRERLGKSANERAEGHGTKQLRSQIADSLGLAPLPPRLPLEMKTYGSRTSGGVTIKRVSFQTWPGHRAGGWLWAPVQQPDKPAPAILCPHGHWSEGALHEVVQARAAQLAGLGATVLVVDNAHVENIAAGVSAIGFMTWNNIRAIDLLLSFPGVDPSRIGITGASGGAQQTMYMMALDDRVAAAAPICMISQFKEILSETSSHCGCNHPPRIGFIGDEPAFCALFAPRPVFYGSVTGDWTARFPVQGLPRIKAAYRSKEAVNAIIHQHRKAGHNYDAVFRKSVYEFLGGALELTGSSAESKDRSYSSKDLKSLGGPTGRALQGGLLVTEHLARRQPFNEFSQLAPALSWAAPRVDMRLPTITMKTKGFEPRLIEGEGGAPVELHMRRGARTASGTWVLVVSEDSLTTNPESVPPSLQEIKRLSVVTPRFGGEYTNTRRHWERNGLLLGCGAGYIMAHDIARAAASLPGSDKVRLLSTGATGPAALIAATICHRIEAVVIPHYGVSYRKNGNRHPQLPEILRVGGMKAVIAAIPKTCTLTIGGASKGLLWRANDEGGMSVLHDNLSPAQIQHALTP